VLNNFSARWNLTTTDRDERNPQQGDKKTLFLVKNFFSAEFCRNKFFTDKKKILPKSVPVKMLSIFSAVGLKGYALSGKK
jgi:hypothetical protein